MEIRLAPAPLDQMEADALVLFQLEGVSPETTDSRVTELFESGEFTGKYLEIAILHSPSGLKAKRLVLAGAGKQDKFTAMEARNLAGAVLRNLKGKGLRSIAVDPGIVASDDVAAALVEGALLGDFEPDRHKTSSDAKSLEAFILVAPDSARAAFERRCLFAGRGLGGRHD